MAKEKQVVSADNKEVEYCLLASGLISQDYLSTIITLLSEEDFLDPINKKVFSLLVYLKENNIKIDTITLMNYLVENKIFPNQDKADKYIKNILTLIPNSYEVKTYAYILKDATLLRNFMAKINQIQSDYQNNPINDINEFVFQSEKELHEIANTRRVSDFLTMKQIIPNVLTSLYERIVDRRNTNKPSYLTGISTGYTKLDFVTGGFRKTEYIVIGARPSVGKTAFALNLLYNIAKKGIPVGFFSLEMSYTSITKRLLQIQSYLTTENINDLVFDYKATEGIIDKSNTPEDQLRNVNLFEKACAIFSKLNIYIDDSPGQKMSDIEQKARNLKKRHPDLGCIAIDYLGLIQPESNQSNVSRVQQVTDISRRLKSLARELDIPLVVLSQLSRDSDKTKHEPTLSDLRDSGSIEQDADIVMLLSRSDYQVTEDKDDPSTDNKQQNDSSSECSSVTVDVKKNRNGKTEKLKFAFTKNISKYEPELDEQQSEEIGASYQ